MATRPEQLALATEFPAATVEQWRALVAGVLRKSGVDTDAADPVESLLRSTTYDGIAVEPLYDPAPARSLPAAGPWWLLQAVDEPDPADANKAILADLEGGVGALWLRLGADAIPLEGLERALSGVYLEFAPVVLDQIGRASCRERV